MYASLLFIHLLAITLWMGGQFFMVAVLIPAFRAHEREARLDLFRRVGHQFFVVSIPVLLIILITGIIMATDRKYFTSDITAFKYKMDAVAVVLISTVIHVIAARKRWMQISRYSMMVTGISSIMAIWFAAHMA